MPNIHDADASVPETGASGALRQANLVRNMATATTSKSLSSNGQDKSRQLLLLPFSGLDIVYNQLHQISVRICMKGTQFNIFNGAGRPAHSPVNAGPRRPIHACVWRGSLKLHCVQSFYRLHAAVSGINVVATLACLIPQDLFLAGAWQLLDSDGSLPARSPSRPKPRLSLGLPLTLTPESYILKVRWRNPTTVSP